MDASRDNRATTHMTINNAYVGARALTVEVSSWHAGAEQEDTQSTVRFVDAGLSDCICRCLSQGNYHATAMLPFVADPKLLVMAQNVGMWHLCCFGLGLRDDANRERAILYGISEVYRLRGIACTVGASIDFRDDVMIALFEDDFNRDYIILYLNVNKILPYAVRLASLDFVRWLIGRGADLEAKYYWGKTVLIIAAENGKCDVVKVLAERGADLEAKDEYGRTALEIAVEYGEHDVARYLRRIASADTGRGTNNRPSLAGVYRVEV